MTDRKTLTPLLDADTFVYACGFAADAQLKNKLIGERNDEIRQHYILLEAGDTNLGDAPQEYSSQELETAIQEFDYERWALANVKTVINDIQELFNPNVKVYLTGSGNFREQLATIQQYKGNRDPTHKPKYYKEIKDYLRSVWNAEVVQGREADDALGCAQYGAEPETTVIVSIDKDMDNIPGYHYNWRKKEFYYIEPERANYLFWIQVLMGDKTDHIRGIPKIGPKTAEKILDVTDKDWMGMAEAVLAAYEKAGLSWAEFYENASLLWIQRQEGLNWDDKPYSYSQMETNDEE